MEHTQEKQERESKILNLVLLGLSGICVVIAAATGANMLRSGTDDLFLILVSLLLALLFAVPPYLWAKKKGLVAQPFPEDITPVEDAHDDHHGGSNRENIFIWGGLLLLTGIEVVLGYYKVGVITMLIILIGLSLIKAAMIVAYFMHMKFETKPFILTVIPVMIVLLCLFAILFPDGNRLFNNRPDPAIQKVHAEE
ncbi:MAG: cytochrome C oxidase subunit IV family protein [Acidobacteriota bacterium]